MVQEKQLYRGDKHRLNMVQEKQLYRGDKITLNWKGNTELVDFTWSSKVTKAIKVGGHVWVHLTFHKREISGTQL